jgi:hypothetical protein
VVNRAAERQVVEESRQAAEAKEHSEMALVKSSARCSFALMNGERFAEDYLDWNCLSLGDPSFTHYQL